jgi:agmatinase
LDDKRSKSHSAEQKPRLTKNFQLLAIINGLSDAGLRIIGSDVVEFTPVYDNAAETTGIAVGQIVYEILQWMVKVPVKTPKAAAI